MTYPLTLQSHVVVIVAAAQQPPILAQICKGLIVGPILRQHAAEQPGRLQGPLIFVGHLLERHVDKVFAAEPTPRIHIPTPPLVAACAQRLPRRRSTQGTQRHAFRLDTANILPFRVRCRHVTTHCAPRHGPQQRGGRPCRLTGGELLLEVLVGLACTGTILCSAPQHGMDGTWSRVRRQGDRHCQILPIYKKRGQLQNTRDAWNVAKAPGTRLETTRKTRRTRATNVRAARDTSRDSTNDPQSVHTFFRVVLLLTTLLNCNGVPVAPDCCRTPAVTPRGFGDFAGGHRCSYASLGGLPW